MIYTTNTIKSLNSTYRRLNSRHSDFSSVTALLEAHNMATFEATKMVLHVFLGNVLVLFTSCSGQAAKGYGFEKYVLGTS